MKTPHKSQKATIFILFFQVAAFGQAFSPEAWDLIEVLERRIDAGRAGQASLDVLLAALVPEEGCAEWEGQSFWKNDPDLRAAMLEACPDFLPSPGGKSARALRVDLAAEENVRPSAEGLPGPSLSGALRGPLGGLRLAAASGQWHSRRVWLEGPAWKAQAGHLDFADLPRLPFVSGRRSFPGIGGGDWVSGLEGPFAASSSSLDGLALAGRARSVRAAAFGTWNRRPPGTDPEGGDNGRRDALAYSLAAAWKTGGWQGTWQAAHLRLEVPGRDPGRIVVGGMEIRREDPGLRVGFAGSGLWPGRPPGIPPGAVPMEGGTYAEIAWEEGKPGGYLLEAWQATPGWASPLAARPALLRDTADPGILLPGRGEGGARLRSGMNLLEAEAVAFRLQAAAMAVWALGNATEADGGGSLADYPAGPPAGFLAGEGRAALVLDAGPWTGESNVGSGWRREGIPAAGTRLTLGQGLAWKGKRWRAGFTCSRRETAAGAAWPAVFEIARRERGGGRWQARLAAGDARHPTRNWRLSLDQAWPLGSGLNLSHALRLPVSEGELREDFGYRVKLEFGGR